MARNSQTAEPAVYFTEEEAALANMLREIQLSDSQKNSPGIYHEFLTDGAMMACQYGVRWQLITPYSLEATSVYGSEMIVDGVQRSMQGTFGVCKSPKFASDTSKTQISVSAYESLDGVAKTAASGRICSMRLSNRWGSLPSGISVYDPRDGEYKNVPTTNSYLVCYYGGGCVYPLDSGQVVTVNSGQGSNQPLNDYKTTGNPNLIGISSSKSYITLAQLNSFGFEYNRQTYINKLAGYSASDFQGVTSNATAYYNQIQNHLDYLNNEFSNISNQNIISNFNYYIEKYNIGKYDEAVLMFMAITAQESLYGIRMAELWDSTLGYNYNQRGGGYSQLTGVTSSNPSGNQIPFMSSIGYSSNDINNILDLPFHIATYLPFSSACYAWTKGNAMGDDITTNIVEYGINKGAEMKLIYLAISYAINGGYTKSGLQTLLNGKNFSEPGTPPNGWADRKASYNKAINIFSNGTSSFVQF